MTIRQNGEFGLISVVVAVPISFVAFNLLLYRPFRLAVKNPEDTPRNPTIRDNLLWNIVTTVLIGATLYVGLI